MTELEVLNNDVTGIQFLNEDPIELNVEGSIGGLCP